MPSRQGITQLYFDMSFECVVLIWALGLTIRALHGMAALDFMASEVWLDLHDSWGAGGIFFYFGMTSGVPGTCPGDQNEVGAADRLCCVGPEPLHGLTWALLDYRASKYIALTDSIVLIPLSCSKAQFTTCITNLMLSAMAGTELKLFAQFNLLSQLAFKLKVQVASYTLL